MGKVYARTVCNISGREIGYLEKRSNKSLDSKTANAGSANYTKYNRDMKKVRGAGTLNDYWCANFVSWCFYKAYGKEKGKALLYGYTNYVPTFVANFKKKGRFYKRGQKRPAPGCLIIFKNESHVGLVYKVTDKYVYTVEGNTSSAKTLVSNGGAVAKKAYLRSSSYIYGYCHPKFDGIEKPKKTEPKKIDISKYPTIREGDKSVYVQKLRIRLKAKGYKIKSTTSKNFNKQLKRYVRNFQRIKGLKIDGVVGKDTWRELYK